MRSGLRSIDEAPFFAYNLIKEGRTEHHMSDETESKTPKQMAEAVLIPLDKSANSKSKDSVFCDLFSDIKYVRQLYSVLHEEDDSAETSDITLVTLDHKMLRAQYNDLGFIIGNRLMILVEEQSKWSVNILLRLLMYLGETYLRYIKNNDLDIHGTKKIIVPKPELYIIYPKDRKDLPDEISLSKDVFEIDDPEHIFLDLKAKIIYDSKQGDIINQYITFCRVFDEQTKLNGKTEKAVMETIRICRDRNVLKDYLARQEVANIMFGYYDEEREKEYLREEGREEGRKEGAIMNMMKLIKQGLITVSQAAEISGMTDEEFEKKAASYI